MFYSHEVLTSRKYGVATVWLVATLGAKSNLKRINRKQILDVDVAKACQTIIDPVAPMALRLQGNLLYGVSRVYLQQCGYVLSDAQNAYTSMRMMLRTVKNLALDPDAGKVRPEQLILPDDPSFLPELDLPLPELLGELDLRLGLDIARSGESQSLTPFGSQRSQSESTVGAIGGLVLPSSSPAPLGNFGLGDDHEAGGPSDLLSVHDDIQLGEPDFTFDENGEFVEGPPPSIVAGTPTGRSGSVMHSDAGASAKVRREHEEGRIGAAQIPNDPMDLDLPIFGEDLPEDDAFPTIDHEQGNSQAEIIHSSSTASAPMRKKRTARTLPMDTAMELKNRDLADWNANYLQNMDKAIDVKAQTRMTSQAKKNAKYLLWDSGIGGIAQQFAGVAAANPFDMFVGDNFFELITGVSRKKTAGTKHDRDSGIDDATQNESRHVRQKTNEPEDQIGRAQDDEGFSMPVMDEEIELPREAATALDDEQIFSAMPWNISASKHGSSAVPRSGRPGMTDQSRPGSRLVSASPSRGRGQPLTLEALKSPESDGDLFGGNDFGMIEGPSSPPTVVGIPQQPSTRVREALSAEGTNFFDFVVEGIAEKRNRAQNDPDIIAGLIQAGTAADIDGITFEELLPPSMNNTVIACQGLMMVLALGTNSMLDVQQPDDFGDIHLKLTDKAKASQVIEISESEEEESDDTMEGDMQEEQEGANLEDQHFEEQFAAGHVAHVEDDHDSLYDD